MGFLRPDCWSPGAVSPSPSPLHSPKFPWLPLLPSLVGWLIGFLVFWFPACLGLEELVVLFQTGVACLGGVPLCLQIGPCMCLRVPGFGCLVSLCQHCLGQVAIWVALLEGVCPIGPWCPLADDWVVVVPASQMVEGAQLSGLPRIQKFVVLFGLLEYGMCHLNPSYPLNGRTPDKHVVCFPTDFQQFAG